MIIVFFRGYIFGDLVFLGVVQAKCIKIIKPVFVRYKNIELSWVQLL